jgi:hypothetical protein
MNTSCCANKPRKENYFCKKVRTLLIIDQMKNTLVKNQDSKVLVENELALTDCCVTISSQYSFWSKFVIFTIDHDELNMVEDIHVTVPKTIDSNYQDACAQDLNPDSLMSDSTILNINTNNAGLDLTDSNTETFHTPAKMGGHILDFNTLQLQRCMAENTPKFKTKKNPDKEIRKIWEKLEEQSKSLLF